MSEREAFEASEFFDTGEGAGQQAVYLLVWQAACKWQRERDAEICKNWSRKNELPICCDHSQHIALIEVEAAILNQGSKE